MTDYQFVCNECGRMFRGLTGHIGEEMCPECGSIDLSRDDPPSGETAASDPAATTASDAAPSAVPQPGGAP
jgi:DNA-directed RNA polymerase subunit RPC12/RpoP